jgi:recombination protein RecA
MSKKKVESADKLRSLLSGLAKPRATTWLRSGIHALDLCVGGGLPEGRIIEIAGTEAAGKTTIALMAIAAAQRAGGAGIFYDAETALDFRFAEKMGVDTSLMVYEQVRKVEDVRDFLVSHVGQIRAVAPKIPLVVAVDSIAALSADKEWKEDKESGGEVLNDNDQPGRRAKALSDLFRFYNSFIAQNNVVFICVNQLRDKIGTMFGEKQDSPGGHALKYHASVVIRLNKGKAHGPDSGPVEYIDAYLKVKKNKVSPPLRQALLKFNMNRGFDTFAGLDEVLVEAGRLKEKRGAFLLGEEEFPKEALPEMVAKHPELLEPWL